MTKKRDIKNVSRFDLYLEIWDGDYYCVYVLLLLCTSAIYAIYLHFSFLSLSQASSAYNLSFVLHFM